MRAASRRPLPKLDHVQPPPAGHRDTASRNWGRAFCRVGQASRSGCCVTDTTLRDAHQSLLATRVRTHDMLRHRRRLRPADAATVLDRNVGRGDVRHGHAVLEGRSLATAGRAARADSQHPVSDAASRLERRGLHELSRQRRQGVRRGSRPRPASTCSASSTRSTGCPT